ncbi:MAG: hypothetical protein NTX86_05270 [Candidatus Dependentiae bacterium]|nr:hypothetical protein [Candidatus Dependentiae bacterium]
MKFFIKLILSSVWLIGSLNGASIIDAASQKIPNASAIFKSVAEEKLSNSPS